MGCKDVVSPAARSALCAVLRKNMVLTTRNKRDAVREFGMPVLLLGVLVLLSRIEPNNEAPAVVTYPTYQAKALSTLTVGKQLWLAPCASLSDGSLPAAVGLALTAAGAANVTCFPCESPSQACGAASLLTAYPAYGSAVLGAVVFDSTVLPVRYRIRMDRNTYAPDVGQGNFTPAYGADGFPAAPDATAGEWAAAVLPLQLAVDSAISTVLANASMVITPPSAALTADSSILPGGFAVGASSFGSGLAANATVPIPQIAALLTRQFPTPPYSVNALANVLAILVPIYMTLMFTLQIRVLLTRILEEKERKIKMTLKMMGLTDSVFWLSWLITALIKQTALNTIIVAVAIVGKIFPYSSFGPVWVFFFAFQLTAIGFVFAVTSLFSKSRTGGAVGMLIYLALAGPSYALTSPAVPRAIKLLISLLAPAGFNLGVSVIMSAETAKIGLTWSDFGDDNVSPAGVSLAALTGMLLLDAVLYGFLAWYLDKVVPTEFGTTRHPLFCLGYVKGGAAGRGRVRSAGGIAAAAAAGAKVSGAFQGDSGRLDRAALIASGGWLRHRSSFLKHFTERVYRLGVALTLASGVAINVASETHRHHLHLSAIPFALLVRYDTIITMI